MDTVCKPGDLAVINRNLIPAAEFARGWIVRVTKTRIYPNGVFWEYEGEKYFPDGGLITSFADNILTPIPGLDNLGGEDEMLTIMKNKLNKEETDKRELVEHS